MKAIIDVADSTQGHRKKLSDIPRREPSDEQANLRPFVPQDRCAKARGDEDGEQGQWNREADYLQPESSKRTRNGSFAVSDRFR